MADGKRPWWAAPLIGGLSLSAGIGGTLVLGGGAAQGRESRVAVSSLAGSNPDAEWRVRMESKLDQALQQIAETKERVARIEGRLERK
jgi:hypothetical protein